MSWYNEILQESLLSMDLKEQQENSKTTVSEEPTQQVKDTSKTLLLESEHNPGDEPNNMQIPVEETILEIASETTNHNNEPGSKGNQETYKNPDPNLGQDQCQILNKESTTNTTKEKTPITSVLENSKTTNLEKFQNKELQKIYTTDNIIKIWQDPNFLKMDTRDNTMYAKNNVESEMIAITLLGINRMNFPLTTNMETRNPIRESLHYITGKLNNHSNIRIFDKALEALELQTKEHNKAISRKYSFCYGHIPYTAIFEIFASESQEQGIANKTEQGTLKDIAPKGDPGFQQDFGRARTIMTNITKTIQESTRDSGKNNTILKDTYKTLIPNIGFPWKPKNKLLNEHISTIYDQDMDQETLLRKSKFPPSLYQPKDEDSNEDKKYTIIQNDYNHTRIQYSNILQNEIRSTMDKEVDETQDFNDDLLQSNGFKMFSFMETSMNPQIYAGAMITELEPGFFMYICKPCDMVGFLQTRFLEHLATCKHQVNTNKWIQQHYILHEPQFNIYDKNPFIKLYTSSLQSSNSELIFNNMMEVIANQSFFPTQHKVKAAVLMTKYFKATNKMEIQFIPAFEKDMDAQGHNHWIILAFKNMQKRHRNVRQYLIENFRKNNLEIIIKSPAQKMEIETIADLARLLFKMLVECDFIPTDYLIILAIIMSQSPTWDYPESKSQLFNNHYIDLLLEEGSILLAKEEKSINQENCNTEHTLHNNQNLTEDIETPDQKCIQLLPENKCKEFIDHCNSISFNWKLTTIECFKLQLIQWYPIASSWTTTQIYDVKLQILLWEETNEDSKEQEAIATQSMEEIKHIKNQEKKIGKIDFQNKAATRKSSPSPQKHISRDVEEGNIPNYCQTTNFELVRSISGYPMCNYCGLTSHKRQFCSKKKIDRTLGLTRTDHPDKELNMAAAQAIPWHIYANSTLYYPSKRT